MSVASRSANRWLTAIFLLAAALRLFPIWFSLEHPYARPDEAEAISHAVGILHGDLNPHFFHWPSLTFYLFAAVLGVVTAIRELVMTDGTLTRDVALLSTRAVVALAGAATVVPLFHLARRISGEIAGLIAAFFLAVAVLHVRDSHFAMTDVLMTLLVTASLALLLAACDRALGVAHFEQLRLRDFALAGALGGLATSTKYNAAAIAAAMGVAQVLLLLRFKRAPWSPRTWAPVAVFTLAMIAAFIAATPFAVLDAPTFTADVAYDMSHLSLGHGTNVGRGWYVHAVRSLPYGCGPVVFLAAIAGVLLALWRRPRHVLVIGGFALAFYAAIGSGYTVFFRYVMPLVPVVCLFAAVSADRSSRWLAGVRGFSPAKTAFWIALVIGGESLVTSVWMDVLLARTDTRVLATRWIKTQLRPEHSLHDGGGTYVKLGLRGWPYHEWHFDPATASFGDPEGKTPDWLVVHRSPLQLYAKPEPALERLAAAGYDVAFEARGTRSIESSAVYDEQDAFFLPFSRLHEVERPGPTITIYRKSRIPNP